LNLAVITLSNPPLNRLTEQMIGELDSAIIAITQTVPRPCGQSRLSENFSYGGDISQWPDMNTPELRVLFERYMAVFNSFERLPIPVIAAVQGLCLGGGFELILPAYLAADVLI
jgi:enoyl-CoA hydratase/carnithine racemase